MLRAQGGGGHGHGHGRRWSFTCTHRATPCSLSRSSFSVVLRMFSYRKTYACVNLERTVRGPRCKQGALCERCDALVYSVAHGGDEALLVIACLFLGLRQRHCGKQQKQQRSERTEVAQVDSVAAHGCHAPTLARFDFGMVVWHVHSEMRRCGDSQACNFVLQGRICLLAG